MTERARIDALRSILAPAGPTPGLALGIGDDAAVLEPPAGKLVLTVDEQVEGTHFRRAWLSLFDLGYRATMAAASDVAAMAARPWVATASLVLPDDVTDADLAELARGQASAAAELGAPIVGGNLARGAQLSIATTVLGVADAPLTRAGARVGDAIWVAGALGLAGACWRARARGIEPSAAVQHAWARPRARIEDGLRLHGVAHAAIDVSDGLARDLGHVARASGVRVVLEATALDAAIAPELAAVATQLGLAARDLVLGGGEDYALVAASPVALPGFVRIGACVAGEGVVVREGGREIEVDLGFDHFA